MSAELKRRLDASLDNLLDHLSHADKLWHPFVMATERLRAEIDAIPDAPEALPSEMEAHQLYAIYRGNDAGVPYWNALMLGQKARWKRFVSRILADRKALEEKYNLQCAGTKSRLEEIQRLKKALDVAADRHEAMAQSIETQLATARQETAEECAKMVVQEAKHCPERGLERHQFCDHFGCFSLDEVAEAIRARFVGRGNELQG